MKRTTTIAGLAIATTLAIPVAAQAHVQPSANTAPNSCKTFTVKSVDKLFGVPASTKPKQTQTRSGKGQFGTSQCTTKTGKHQLLTNAGLTSGGFGGPYTCHPKPKLGPDGQLCNSKIKTFKSTVILFSKDGISFSDNDNVILPHHGKKLYKFALAQYKAFTG